MTHMTFFFPGDFLVGGGWWPGLGGGFFSRFGDFTCGGGLRPGQLAAQHVGSCRATRAEGTFAPGGDDEKMAETAVEVNFKHL